ncbi:hypothetical protein HY732_01915 [Candidatus Uhrbacteria bacterium]|nr:hypothetical protein [Candidatus Uhrbacteria bacterium]
MAHDRPDDLEEGSEQSAQQQNEPGVAGIPSDEQRAAHALAQAETGGDRHERAALEVLQNSPLLIIEDDKENIESIQVELNRVNKTDAVFADSVPGVGTRIAEMLKNKEGGERLLVISDLQIFNQDGDDIADERAGIRAIANVQKEVEKWNTAHPGVEPIRLEIIVNSSMLNSQQDLDDFIKENSDRFKLPETIVAGNHGRKAEAVDTFLSYLKAQEEQKEQ